MPRGKAQRGPTLFSKAADERLEREAPLAARMRPRTLDEYIGQEHLVGEGHILRRLIEADNLPSIILWGPPGTGKTTLARIVANMTKSEFAPVSAVSSGVADLRRVIAEAKERLALEGRRTILFIDEIHRFNKSQQDAVLPYVEDGTITLIGATTENPSFEVIGPLLSRSRVFTLHALEPEQIAALLERAIEDKEHGLPSIESLGGQPVDVDGEAVEALSNAVGGDARIALNALEMAAASAPPSKNGKRHVTREMIEEALQHRTYLYDKQGDAHYDTISAFIKSVRGSDVDASLYWLARMIESGEDPLFIIRRMVILAAEDIGLADPQALVVATACQQAVHFIGLPEGFLPMAECAIYLASAPKSNSALTAYAKALEDVRATQGEPVPLHLRNAPTGLMKSHGLRPRLQVRARVRQALCRAVAPPRTRRRQHLLRARRARLRSEDPRLVGAVGEADCRRRPVMRSADHKARVRRTIIDIAKRRQRPGSGSLLDAEERKPMQDAPDLNMILDGLPWAVVGAVATRLYMAERATADIDIVLPVALVGEAGKRLSDAGFSQFATLAIGGSSWRSSDGALVDVIEGRDPWWPTAITEAADNRDVEGWPVLTLPYLVLMKLIAGRAQDVADVTRMLGGAPDEELNRVREIISKLAPDLLEDVESLIALGRLEHDDPSQ